MKNKLIIFSAILLISTMVAGGTFAWFTSSPDNATNKFKMGIVEVKVIENGLEDIRIKNLGTSDCYIRVRLMPQWSNPNLSISNVNINIKENYWIEKDGYYYYKHTLQKNEITSNLIKSIEIEDLPAEYKGASLTLKVVAEGVQSAHKAWKDVWSISSLPF